MFNPSKNWVAPDSIGITVGAAYLALANYEDGLVWRTFEKVPEIKRARRELK